MEPVTLSQAIGREVKRLREDPASQAKTQHAFAAILGTTRTNLSHLETGRQRDVSVDVFWAIARAFDVIPAVLLHDVINECQFPDRTERLTLTELRHGLAEAPTPGDRESDLARRIGALDESLRRAAETVVDGLFLKQMAMTFETAEVERRELVEKRRIQRIQERSAAERGIRGGKS